jgi:signal transduction histidine kinase
LEGSIEEIEKRKNVAKVSHFVEEKTNLTTIRTYQRGMPGNYEAYHKVS